jgi:hypothetical protein
MIIFGFIKTYPQGEVPMPKPTAQAFEQPVLNFHVARYLLALSPIERAKMARAILIRLDTSRMTKH